MKAFYYLLLCIVCITGCSKDDKGNNDNTPPVIASSSPVDNQFFTDGQIVNIAAHITDNEKIFVVHVHISDKNSGQLFFDIHRYPDNNSYELAESFTAKAGTTYRILVIARDTGGNETSTTTFVTGN